MKTLSLLLTLAAATALTGCACDCAGSSITVSTYSSDGTPLAVDAVVYTTPDGQTGEAWCQDDVATDAEDYSCSEWFVDAWEEGTYTVTALEDGEALAEGRVTLNQAALLPNLGCCRNVMQGSIGLRVP